MHVLGCSGMYHLNMNPIKSSQIDVDQPSMMALYSGTNPLYLLFIGDPCNGL